MPLPPIPSPLPRAQPTSVVTPRPSQAPVITPLPGYPHLSQGILATTATGTACSVYYIYGAAQAVALESRAAGTPFDP